MVNRALHAAARGGSLEFLKELMVDCSDAVAYRDIQGSTILHTASGRGQVEVVKYLLASIDMIGSRDKKGNTALHIAAFRGHLPVAEALMAASPSSSRSINEAGDTFLHMAVAGFRTPGFRRLDRQMELVRKLMDGNAASIQEVVNVRNKDGRTALHMALIGNVHADLVELLMTVRSIDLNVRDGDGMTPLDVLRQHPRSASSEVLIKQLISAGGMANSKDHRTRSAIASHIKMQGVANSPGTAFRVSDAEIFLYTGIQASDASARPSSCSSASKSEVSHFSAGSDRRKRHQIGSIGNVARHLRVLLGWHRRRGKTAETLKKVGDDESLESFKKLVDRGEAPTPLRQQFSKSTWTMMMASNKRPLSVRSAVPSPATRKKFAASSATEKRKGICLENENDGASCSSSSMNYSAVENATPRWSLVNARLMNQFFCFGALHMEADEQQSNRASNPSLVSAV
ncbi:Ankyrin repeat [Musa troglodytarum]|nr:Ankyrin repeat [Musa troglodytarum]